MGLVRYVKHLNPRRHLRGRPDSVRVSLNVVVLHQLVADDDLGLIIYILYLVASSCIESVFVAVKRNGTTRHMYFDDPVVSRPEPRRDIRVGVSTWNFSRTARARPGKHFAWHFRSCVATCLLDSFVPFATFFVQASPPEKASIRNIQIL